MAYSKSKKVFEYAIFIYKIHVSKSNLVFRINTRKGRFYSILLVLYISFC